VTTIKTRLGTIQGISNNNVDVFRGIRFAEPPVGTRRFRSPVAAEPWKGTFDATGWGNRSLQAPPQQPGLPEQGELSEDCLFLTIYAPASASTREATRPVLVWIHGGAFIMGSGNGYDGSELANQGDVVVVTVNYRLGMLGFFDLSGLDPSFAGSASNGIRDQILALEWVRDNIADYGGDANNVTIFGESAGGASINCILAASEADGLYHRAIAHSGGTPSMPPLDRTNELAGHLNVEVDNLIDTLAAMTGEEILAVQMATGLAGGSVIDGTVVTRSTAAAMSERGASSVPYIAGSNHDEGTLFTMMSQDNDFEKVLSSMGRNLARSTLDGADPTAYIDVLRSEYPDASAKEIYETIWVDMFRRASINNAEAASTAGPGGWLYRFDLRSKLAGGALGATHASEIAFTFNSYAAKELQGIGFHDGRDPVVKQLAHDWSNTVLAFARTGNPNSGDLPDWPRYEQFSRQSLVLDAESRIAGAELDRRHRGLWGDD
jgi:para-nitrobenzyl esterase